MEEKWVIPKVSGVVQTQTEEKLDLHSFIICNEAENIPLDLQIITVTLGLASTEKNQLKNYLS